MPDRLATASLIDRLVEERHRTSFFQFVQLLLRSTEGAVSPGGEGPVAREVLRFRPSTGLGFPASDVESFEVLPAPDGELPQQYRLTVNFLGLYGPASPMPNHFSEELLWAGPEGETLRDFLDIFHHRMISFVYRAWEKYRHYIQFAADGPDRSTRRALCLIGLGTEGMLPALGGSYLELLRVAGLINAKSHSAAGLTGILRDHFPEIPLKIESLVEREVPIPADQTVRLGTRSCRLGHDLCLGERIVDVAGNFRVTLGPLSRDKFRAFLPDKEAFARLVRTIRFYVSDPLSFSVGLELSPGEAPALSLSPDSELPLGRMSWLGANERTTGKVVFTTRAQDPLWAGAAHSS